MLLEQMALLLMRIRYHLDDCQYVNVTFRTETLFESIYEDVYFHVKLFGFQATSDCSVGKTNDLIPIIVGCVLAGMVVVVLLAYLVGRRFNKDNYSNMDS